MNTRQSKQWTPAAAAGVKNAIAAKARKRRQTQMALAEIGAHAFGLPRNDLAPSLQYEMAPIESLRSASRRVRRCDAEQKARLEASVDRFGICRPILISSNRSIVEGHGLWEVAKAKGISQVPCIIIDHLSEADLRLLGIALNRLSEIGSWDFEALQAEFEELTVLGFDLVDTGFEMAEIDAIMLDEDEDGDDDLALGAAPPPAVPPCLGSATSGSSATIASSWATRASRRLTAV